jgi:hypothetical protein
MRQIPKSPAFSTEIVEFLCHEEDFGLIPEPRKAARFLPAWFKKLGHEIPGGAASTIKLCAPFLDSMTLGFVIPLAADVEFATNEDASEVTFSSSFHRPLVERHSPAQINGAQHPAFPKPPLKFMNYWAVRVPQGFSVLFVPPLNRPDPRFECLSGLVDCDKYFEFVNFPFIFHAKNYRGVVAAGTPLVQAIPLRRSDLGERCAVGPMNEAALQDLLVTRSRRQSDISDYRKNIRTHRNSTARLK